MDEAQKHILEFTQGDQTDAHEIASKGQAIVTLLRGRISDIAEQKGLSEFYLGGVVKKIREQEAWRLFPGVADHWTFGDFCREILKMSQQKVMGLLRVWGKSQELHMTPEEVDELGWSTADAILRRAKTHIDIRNLIEQYRQSANRADFLRTVQSSSDIAPGRIRRKKLTLRVDDTEDRFIQETLERAAEAMKSELNKDVSPEKVVLFIMTQWRLSISTSQKGEGGE